MKYILLSESLMKKDGLKFRSTRRLTTYSSFKGFPIGDMLRPEAGRMCCLNLPELVTMMNLSGGFTVNEFPF